MPRPLFWCQPAQPPVIWNKHQHTNIVDTSWQLLLLKFLKFRWGPTQFQFFNDSFPFTFFNAGSSVGRSHDLHAGAVGLMPALGKWLIVCDEHQHTNILLMTNAVSLFCYDSFPSSIFFLPLRYASQKLYECVDLKEVT